MLSLRYAIDFFDMIVDGDMALENILYGMNFWSN